MMSVKLMTMPGRVPCSDLSNKLVQLLSVFAHLQCKCINRQSAPKCTQFHFCLSSAPCEGYLESTFWKRTPCERNPLRCEWLLPSIALTFATPPPCPSSSQSAPVSYFRSESWQQISDLHLLVRDITRKYLI